MSNDFDSTFIFDQRNEFSNFYNQYTNKDNNNSLENKASENKIKNNFNNKTLIEVSKEYEEYDESEQKKKVDRIIDIDENLSENLFSSAINFGIFKEFPSINYNLNTSNNNNNFNKNGLNAIEENEFEENFNNENYKNTQANYNLGTPIKSEEKEIINEQALFYRNSLLNNQMNLTQTQKLRNSISKNSFDESSKNNYFFALNSLHKNLSKDDFIQRELNNLNEKFINFAHKKSLKGLKFDKEIHVDFYQLMVNFLSKDLKNKDDMTNFSYNELIRRKVLNENVIY